METLANWYLVRINKIGKRSLRFILLKNIAMKWIANIHIPEIKSSRNPRHRILHLKEESFLSNQCSSNEFLESH